MVKCKKCGIELTDDNWYNATKRHGVKKCKTCEREYKNEWSRNNRDKYRKSARNYTYRNGVKPMNENKKCTQYLGCFISENILSKVFLNVQKMPMHNPGYDFICNKGKKIDVKSSCIRYSKNNTKKWGFDIKNNQIADYFLCIAFDNREDLNPLHLWLLPSNKFNHLNSTTICETTINKWDEYKLSIDKVVECCNFMKGANI